MRNFQKQRGLSLVSTMMALGIGMIILLFVLQLLENSDKMIKASNLEADRLQLAASIRSRLNCDKTFSGNFADPTTACASDQYLDLRDRAGNTFLPASGKTIGSWDVRARCKSTGFEVRAAKITSASKDNTSAWDFSTKTPGLFQSHPLRSGQTMTWSWDDSANQRHTLISIGELCGGIFSQNDSPPDDCTPTYVPCVDKPKFKVFTRDLSFIAFNVPLESMSYCISKNSTGVGVNSNGSVTCPVGWRMIGGGVNCGFASGSAYTSKDPNVQGGVLLASSAASGGRTYSANCCTFLNPDDVTNGTIKTGTVIDSGRDAIWAICSPVD
jgi:hypothetical protein